MSPETVERIEPVVNTLGTKGGIEYADAYLKDNDARFVFSFTFCDGCWRHRCELR